MAAEANNSKQAGKVAVVTGASSGIGEEVARRLAKAGYSLALSARRKHRLDSLASEIKSKQPEIEVLVVAADLADRNGCLTLASAVLERFGGIDVLVNNAGNGLAEMYEDCDTESLRTQIEVNFTSPVVLTHLFLASLVERKGLVINIGSSITTIPNPTMGVYGATKAALSYWNTALRRELRGRGVRVCLVEPGPIATGFFDAARGGPAPATRNPMRDPPPALLAPVGMTADRIVALVDRPKRRLSVPKRTVWPMRVVGGLFQMVPWLGDLAISSTIRMARKARLKTAAETAQETALAPPSQAMPT